MSGVSLTKVFWLTAGVTVRLAFFKFHQDQENKMCFLNIIPATSYGIALPCFHLYKRGSGNRNARTKGSAGELQHFKKL